MMQLKSKLLRALRVFCTNPNVSQEDRVAFITRFLSALEAEKKKRE